MGNYEAQDSFGQKLAALRREAGYTQEEIAERLNVTRQAVSNWERNINEPDLSTLQNVCILFGKNMDDFMKGVLHMNEALQTADTPSKKSFHKYDLAIGLFYAAGLFLGAAIFFVGGFFSMSVYGQSVAAYVWAGSLFAGVSAFFIFGLTAHAVITLKRKDK